MADENGHPNQEISAEDLLEWAREKAAARDALNTEPEPPVIVIIDEAVEISAVLAGENPDRSWLEPENLAAVTRMLQEPERWRTLRMAETPEPIGRHWTTCLQHAEKDGTVYVCARPANHRETAALEGEEAEENDVHMDFNGSVYWDSPLEVHEIKPETRREVWRTWFYTGTLDPKSVAVGAVAVLVMVSVFLAAYLVKH
jgi:hypothetical protein